MVSNKPIQVDEWPLKTANSGNMATSCDYVVLLRNEEFPKEKSKSGSRMHSRDPSLPPPVKTQEIRSFELPEQLDRTSYAILECYSWSEFWKGYAHLRINGKNLDDNSALGLGSHSGHEPRIPTMNGHFSSAIVDKMVLRSGRNSMGLLIPVDYADSPLHDFTVHSLILWYKVKTPI